MRTVGVVGDARTYDQACTIKVVNSTDGMTADVAPFPMDFLGRASTRIVNEVYGFSQKDTVASSALSIFGIAIK